MVDGKDADHRELPQPRQDARGRYLPLRRDQHHFVAEQHAQRARELGAEHDAELARL